MDVLVAVLLALVLAGQYILYRRSSRAEEAARGSIRVTLVAYEAIHDMEKRLDEVLSEVGKLLGEIKDTYTRVGVAATGIEKNLERLRELRVGIDDISRRLNEEAEMLRRALDELSGIRRLEWLPGELRRVLEETLSEKLGEVKRTLNTLARRIESCTEKRQTK